MFRINLVAHSPDQGQREKCARREPRTLAVGDRIQFRAPQRDLKIANGEFATILKLASQNVTLRMNDRREISASCLQLRHIDYGYASTSHAAQDATVDRVIVNIDTTRSAQLVNARQFYVSISRARLPRPSARWS